MATKSWGVTFGMETKVVTAEACILQERHERDRIKQLVWFGHVKKMTNDSQKEFYSETAKRKGRAHVGYLEAGEAMDTWKLTKTKCINVKDWKLVTLRQRQP